LHGANNNTRGLKTIVNSVGAEVAFFNRSQILVQVKSIIRTCLHTSFATDAGITINIHNAITSFFQGIDRADCHTRRIGALIATKYSKVPLYIRKLPNFGVFNPGSKVAHGNIVLCFAGNSTGVAANTLVVIYYKSILHAISVPSFVLVRTFKLVVVCLIIKKPQQLLEL